MQERQVLERSALHGSPFLCPLRYAFRAGPWLVLALPLYSGGTLQLHLDERAEVGRGLPLVEIRFIAAQVALALEAMHSMSMIHRDIKPSNLILNRQGYLVLTDFGLSGRIGATSRSGTRGYWSPETVQRQPQNEASDWWSLGVTLWYAMCGRQPFHRRCTRGGVGDAPPVWEPPPQPRPPASEPLGLPGAQAVQSAAAELQARAEAAPDAVEATEAAVTATVDADADHPRHWKRRLSASELPPDAPEQSPTPEQHVRADEGAPTPTAETLAANAAAAALTGVRRRPRMTEEELNFNTLHMPLEFGDKAKPELASFLRALLERDPAKRLGAEGAGDVRAHALLSKHIDWPLLQKQQLVAPFVPDAQLVYTPDHISDFSGEAKIPEDELLDHFRDWRFNGEAAGYREELREFVQKSTTRGILHSMEAPESVLEKFDLVSDTHSERGSAASGSETHSTEGLRELHEYDNAGVEDYDSD